MSQRNVVKFSCSCALLVQDEATTMCDLLLIFISLIASYYIDLRFPQLSSTSALSFNARPAFFYTKSFDYNSVAICQSMLKLSHFTV